MSVDVDNDDSSVLGNREGQSRESLTSLHFSRLCSETAFEGNLLLHLLAKKGSFNHLLT